jgi:hypothetical protein
MNPVLINALAYQDDGQTCAYYPDSTATSGDKRNVRDGHYSIWGPLHIMTKLDGNGYPINPTAGDVIAYMTGTKTPPGGLELIPVLAHAGLIPTCAMRVRRTSEMGPLQSYAPERSCWCRYDLESTGQTDCTACTTDTDCPSDAPRCNYGYCEVQ